MKRSEVYQTYRKYAQKRDERNMDEICSHGDGEFALQVQQKFAKDLIANSSRWNRIMLYHGIGSGKTCTSITMAEQWLKDNPNGRVSVILPARLKTNFIDELMTPCAFGKYISPEDYKTYISTGAAKIRSAFMKKVEQYYDIMSFERFQRDAQKASSLDEWITGYSNHLIIIDEIHNLINTTYREEVYAEMKTIKRVPMKVSGVRTLLFRYFMEHITDAKVIVMTATPIFDNVKQFKELASIMSGIDKKKMNTLLETINSLRGLISYYPGTSQKAYPTKTYITENIQASPTQIEVLEDITDETKEAFMSKQRQACIATLPKGRKFNIKKVISNLNEYAPKIEKLIDNIENNSGKHFVYSNFVENGLHIVEEALKKRGWVNMESSNYKTYALWDGTLKDANKQHTKNVANNVSNMDGKHLRVILGSPSVKEGVSFKHIQHIHMLDPVWNNSAKIQIEGRAVRFCSHSDIPINHPTLSRNVNIFQYKLTGMPKQDPTCDERIYDVIIPKKEKSVSIAEKALKKVSIDYHLFRQLHEDGSSFHSPQVESGQSIIVVDDNYEYDAENENNKKVPATKCPKPRRPDQDGNCPPNMTLKTNKHGDPCCYKQRKIK